MLGLSFFKFSFPDHLFLGCWYVLWAVRLSLPKGSFSPLSSLSLSFCIMVDKGKKCSAHDCAFCLESRQSALTNQPFTINLRVFFFLFHGEREFMGLPF